MSLGRLPSRGSKVRSLGLALPPAALGGRDGRPAGMWPTRDRRPLKRWRYAGVFGPRLMLCVGEARIGPVPQRWWAIAEPGRPLVERTTIGRGGVRLEGSRVTVEAERVRVAIELEEGVSCQPVEVVSPSGHGDAYAWTRKQAGVPARGVVVVEGRRHVVDCEAIVDDSAGYHERHTAWRWSAGVGRAASGERIGWNLVAGIHDDARASERTLWIDGEPRELGPVAFADDLSSVSFHEGGALELSEWSVRANRTNLLVLRSSYRQPFGTFLGQLPGGLRLTEGYGVMECHDVRW